MNGWMARILVAVVLRPRLWSVSVRQTFRLAGPGWWHRPPFLPVPAVPYARFRAITQYGDPDASPTVEDVLTWLEWARRFPEGVRSGLPTVD